jgi:hypothetical protein
MKSGLRIAAVASLLPAAVSAAFAADKEVGRRVCNSKDVAACTGLVEHVEKIASIRSIAHRHRRAMDIGNHDRARTGVREAVRLDPRHPDLPPGIVPDESRRCSVGMRADIRGMLLDVKRDGKTWSVGTTTYINTCAGLVDPATGFAVLFGSNDSLPSGCGAGKRFVASGDVDYGFQPEFFLKVRSIACE